MTTQRLRLCCPGGGGQQEKHAYAASEYPVSYAFCIHTLPFPFCDPFAHRFVNPVQDK